VEGVRVRVGGEREVDEKCDDEVVPARDENVGKVSAGP
jgi:hypothetical protein